MLVSALTLCLSLLTHSLLLRRELFILVLATELPESALTDPSAGVTNTHVHVRFFVHECWGFELMSTDSYTVSTPIQEESP